MATTCCVMKFRFILLLIFFSQTTVAQTDPRTNQILEIVRIAIRDGKLPRILINNVDSILFTKTSKTLLNDTARHYPLTIGVEATQSNDLKTSEHVAWDDIEIWVWSEEDFFLFDIYWLRPKNIKLSRSRASFDFSTHTWTNKNLPYYKGTIKAKEQAGEWLIKEVKIEPTKNTLLGERLTQGRRKK
jgi:hypothetical protein